MCVSVCLSVRPSVRPSAHLSVCLSACLSWKRNYSARLPQVVNLRTSKAPQFWFPSSPSPLGLVGLRDFLSILSEIWFRNFIRLLLLLALLLHKITQGLVWLCLALPWMILVDVAGWKIRTDNFWPFCGYAPGYLSNAWGRDGKLVT